MVRIAGDIGNGKLLTYSKEQDALDFLDQCSYMRDYSIGYVDMFYDKNLVVLPACLTKLLMWRETHGRGQAVEIRRLVDAPIPTLKFANELKAYYKDRDLSLVSESFRQYIMLSEAWKVMIIKGVSLIVFTDNGDIVNPRLARLVKDLIMEKVGVKTGS